VREGGPRAGHVVWDWNGTLLDDFGLTARIGADSLAALGVPGLSVDDFRDAFERPFSGFYSRLLGRPISDEEYGYVRARYDTEYDAEVFSLSLRHDAITALDHVAGHATQSILSMAPDDQLQSLVDHHAIRHHFVAVEGSHAGSSDGNKVESLRRHLRALAVDPGRAVMIGDTVDDQEAAATCGAMAVLVTSGSQSRAALVATGAPVADSLQEAARLATSATWLI
jgi:phosphoglycolate phosphatase-like HAD superfamily hydrolase